MSCAITTTLATSPAGATTTTLAPATTIADTATTADRGSPFAAGSQEAKGRSPVRPLFTDSRFKTAGRRRSQGIATPPCHKSGPVPRERLRTFADLNLSVVNMRQYRRRLHHGSRFSAAISSASIATSHAVVSRSDLGSVKICRLASSSVRSVLPSGKTTGRSRRLSQDTTQLRNRTLDSRKRGGDSFRRRAVAGSRGPIDPSPASGVPNDGPSCPD